MYEGGHELIAVIAADISFNHSRQSMAITLACPVIVVDGCAADWSHSRCSGHSSGTDFSSDRVSNDRISDRGCDVRGGFGCGTNVVQNCH